MLIEISAIVRVFFPQYCWFTVPYFVLFGTTPHKVTTGVTSRGASSIHQPEDAPLYAVVPPARGSQIFPFPKNSPNLEKSD